MMLRTRLVLAGSLLTALALAGCKAREQDPESTHVTAEEQVLLDRLTRDPFIIISDRRRGDDGYLVVTTHQGKTRVRYLLAPDGPALKQLKVRRMVEEFELRVSEPDRLGTGPAPRGLVH
jgi:hypothetical protein